jgi:hypothetical protein
MEQERGRAKYKQIKRRRKSENERERACDVCVLLSPVQKKIIDAAIHGDPAGGNKK